MSDVFVLFVLLPAWLGCLALSTFHAWNDTAFPPARLQFDAEPGAHPRVIGSRSSSAPVEAHALKAGDRVVRWGDRLLAGIGQAGYFRAVELSTPASHVAEVHVLRDGELLKLTISTDSYRRFTPRLFAAVVFFIVSMILHFRAPPGAQTNSFVIALLATAFVFSGVFAGPEWLMQMSAVSQGVWVALMKAFAVRAFLLFPEGDYPPRVWLRMLPWPFIGQGYLDYERTVGAFVPQLLAHRIQFGISIAFNVTLFVVVAANFVRANAVQRRKIKWVVWGVYVALLLPTISAFCALVYPELSLDYYVAGAAAAIIPLTILIAIMRFNLFDINRVISVTASFSMLIGFFLVALFMGAPRFAEFVAARSELPSAPLQFTLSTLIALTLVAVHRKLRPRIEQLLFHERHLLETQAAAVMQQIQSAESPSAILSLLGDYLARTLRPVSVAIYCRVDSGWTNVVAIGSAIVPGIPEDNEIVRELERSGRLSVFEAGGARCVPVSAASDLGFAATIDLAVALPILREQHLAAIVCLGRKTSGDVYVQSELAILEAINGVVSAHLRSFELTTVVEEARRLGDALRRYVPDAVVRELLDGGKLESKEQEVTVLFVDIRGYSGFTEGRPLPDVFSMLNDYTQHVSGIVQRHGGHVVEFNGDGMMAVFGAPRVLAQKETAAVRTAIAIYEGMSMIGQPQQRAIMNVGVGIATGTAFVGSLKAVDRWIWTAIGETTNRAARLQTLTRELDAAIIIDEKTWLSIDDEDLHFVARTRRAVRGTVKKVNLFMKPLPPAFPEPVLPAIDELLRVREQPEPETGVSYSGDRMH